MFCEILQHFNKFVNLGVRMFSKFTYEESVQKLNSLQSNRATLDQLHKDIQNGKKHSHLKDMERYLQRSDIAVSDLDRLAVVHIAGTKGKGSTSALCESILRHHGFKTGFYSSPHLVVVRERIRINGNIISEEKFSQYFSRIYSKLESSKNDPDDMPKYFHFLTVMAFDVFLREEVDVVVLEVGIGGADDSTNIVRNPYVVGITALGLDHTAYLGNTIEEIAKAKAGIMKKNCDAYTVTQKANAMKILHDKALQVGCTLNLAPDYEKYKFEDNAPPKLFLTNDALKTNASLAIQLAHSWLRKHSAVVTKHSRNNGVSEINGNDCTDDKVVYRIPKETINGLAECFWPGRYQTIDIGFANLYLDGAHTKESMDLCVDWFSKSIGQCAPKVLIFSASGNRNSKALLESLVSTNFESVNFVVPVAFKDINQRSDTYLVQQHTDLLSKCHNFRNEWMSLSGNKTEISVHECIWDAFGHIANTFNTKKTKPSVLITGSLYLVGGVLSIFNPDLKNVNQKMLQTNDV